MLSILVLNDWIRTNSRFVSFAFKKLNNFASVTCFIKVFIAVLHRLKNLTKLSHLHQGRRFFFMFIVSKYQKYKLYIDILIFKVYSYRILKL